MPSEWKAILNYNGDRHAISNADAEQLLDILNGYRKQDEAMFRFKPVGEEADRVLIALGPGIPITVTWLPNT
jgi:hypothetical protein